MSGYDDAVAETARLTNKQIELSETQREELDRRLSILIDRMEESKDNGMLSSGIIQAGEDAPKVSITYFKADEKKDGGEYLTVTGDVHKIDLYQYLIYVDVKPSIPIDNIYQIRLSCITALNDN